MALLRRKIVEVPAWEGDGLGRVGKFDPSLFLRKCLCEARRKVGRELACRMKKKEGVCFQFNQSVVMQSKQAVSVGLMHAPQVKLTPPLRIMIHDINGNSNLGNSCGLNIEDSIGEDLEKAVGTIDTTHSSELV